MFCFGFFNPGLYYCKNTSFIVLICELLLLSSLIYVFFFSWQEKLKSFSRCDTVQCELLAFCQLLITVSIFSTFTWIWYAPTCSYAHIAYSCLSNYTVVMTWLYSIKTIGRWSWQHLLSVLLSVLLRNISAEETQKNKHSRCQYFSHLCFKGRDGFL